MTGPSPYFLFDGVARAALEHYADVFGGAVQLHTFADFGRDDGPPDAIAHGQVSGPYLSVYAADAGTDDEPFAARGVMFALLGTAQRVTLHQWFDRLADGGHVVQALEPRAWAASDGQVTDRFGVRWLIGYLAEAPPAV